MPEPKWYRVRPSGYSHKSQLWVIEQQDADPILVSKVICNNPSAMATGEEGAEMLTTLYFAIRGVLHTYPDNVGNLVAVIARK